MTIDVGVLETLLIAIVVLFIGGYANSKIAFLRNYNIPEPVVGGIAFGLRRQGMGAEEAGLHRHRQERALLRREHQQHRRPDFPWRRRPGSAQLRRQLRDPRRLRQPCPCRRMRPR